MKIPYVSMMSILAATALFVVSGCGESYSGPKLEPCKGTITLDGKPLADANIAMANSQVACTARSDAEGKWEMKTGQGAIAYDGAPLGTFTATVTKTSSMDIGIPEPAADASQEEIEKYQAAYQKAEAEGMKPKSEVPEKYGSAATSGLKVVIEEGGNEAIKLELTSE